MPDRKGARMAGLAAGLAATIAVELLAGGRTFAGGAAPAPLTRMPGIASRAGSCGDGGPVLEPAVVVPGACAPSGLEGGLALWVGDSCLYGLARTDRVGATSAVSVAVDALGSQWPGGIMGGICGGRICLYPGRSSSGTCDCLGGIMVGRPGGRTGKPGGRPSGRAASSSVWMGAGCCCCRELAPSRVPLYEWTSCKTNFHRHASQRGGYSFVKVSFGWFLLHHGQYFVWPVGLADGVPALAALASPGPASI